MIKAQVPHGQGFPNLRQGLPDVEDLDTSG
jgi:hypothetical protein